MTLLCVGSVALTANTVQTTTAANAPSSPCAAAEFRQFDFWAGDWDVTTADGKPAGRNRIEREQGDCALVERWESAGGGTGMSMNYYDPLARRWTQNWVSAGVILTMTGALQGKEMILEGPLLSLADKRLTTLRGIWTPLDDGRVRQHFLESSDGGKTWTEWFDGYYKRR